MDARRSRARRPDAESPTTKTGGPRYECAGSAPARAETRARARRDVDTWNPFGDSGLGDAHLNRLAGGTSVALVGAVVAVVLGSVAAHGSHGASTCGERRRNERHGYESHYTAAHAAPQRLGSGPARIRAA